MKKLTDKKLINGIMFTLIKRKGLYNLYEKRHISSGHKIYVVFKAQLFIGSTCSYLRFPISADYGVNAFNYFNKLEALDKLNNS